MGHNVHRHLRDQENYNRVRTVQGPKIAGRHHSTMAKHIYIKKRLICLFVFLVHKRGCLIPLDGGARSGCKLNCDANNEADLLLTCSDCCQKCIIPPFFVTPPPTKQRCTQVSKIQHRKTRFANRQENKKERT